MEQRTGIRSYPGATSFLGTSEAPPADISGGVLLPSGATTMVIVKRRRRRKLQSNPEIEHAFSIDQERQERQDGAAPVLAVAQMPGSGRPCLGKDFFPLDLPPGGGAFPANSVPAACHF